MVGGRRFCVHVGDQLGVSLVDGRSFDLERRCQLAGRNRQRLGQDAPVADVFDVGVPTVGGVDSRAELGMQIRILRKRLQPHRPLVVCTCPTLGRGLVEREERGQIAAPIADDDGLADQRVCSEVGLDVLGRDVLAVRRDDEILLAAGDPQVAAIVERAEIAGPQPTVVVDEKPASPVRRASNPRQTLSPLIRISPSSARRTDTPGSGGPTVPTRAAPGGLRVVASATSVWP